jgi:hypothetical protein
VGDAMMEMQITNITHRELDPRDVLADLFEELLVQNSEELAAIVLQRLEDAGFEVVPARRSGCA